MCNYILMVGDTVRVYTFHELIYSVRDHNDFFLGHFIIPDLNKRCCWRNKGDLINISGGEKPVADLDDPLFAIFLAVEVGAKEDLVFTFIQVQHMNDLENALGRDVIYDSTVFNGVDL